MFKQSIDYFELTMHILDKAVTPVTPAISEDHPGTLRGIRAVTDFPKSAQNLQETNMFDITTRRH